MGALPTCEEYDLTMCAHGPLAFTMRKINSVKYAQNPKQTYSDSLDIIRDFMQIVSVYGPDYCEGKSAPSDKRFKVYRNGSYYELAGLCFVYNYIHDSHGGYGIYWDCPDYAARMRVEMPTKSGKKHVSYCTRGEMLEMLAR